MKKEAFVIVLLVSLLSAFSLSAITFAEEANPLPEDLVNFYAHDISHLTLSNTSLIMFDSDRSILYYLYYNPLNTTLNLTIDVACISESCMDNSSVLFDRLTTDETAPFVKKAAGIYIITTAANLGKYTYEVRVVDRNGNFNESGQFDIEIISHSLFKEFFHTLWEDITFWS